MMPAVDEMIPRCGEESISFPQTHRLTSAFFDLSAKSEDDHSKCVTSNGRQN